MSAATRAFFDEFRSTLQAMNVSLNSFAKMTGISRKRLAHLFSGGIPRESELRRMSHVMTKTWEPADGSAQSTEI